MTTAEKQKPASQKECIWMKMGLVSFRICTNNYQCGSCEFDQQMQSGELGASGFDALREKMRFMPASQRKCRYMLAGIVAYKICSNSYECYRCEYDQEMDAALQRISTSSFAQKRKTAALKKHKVAGYLLPLNLYYHKGHLWVEAGEKESEGVKVGLDDFARKLVGAVTYVGLPAPGRTVSAGERLWSLKSGERAAEGICPVDGVVVAVNKDLVENPDLLSGDPYGKGWLFTVEPSDAAGCLAGLMREERAEEWLTAEAERLHRMASSAIGVSLSDGGLPADDVFHGLEPAAWKKSVESFLVP
ncbi:MAG: glycine cleavage system protein H [bacterium]